MPAPAVFEDAESPAFLSGIWAYNPYCHSTYVEYFERKEPALTSIPPEALETTDGGVLEDCPSHEVAPLYPGAPHPAPSRPAAMVFGRWEINPTNRTFKVDGKEVALTRTEFDLLRLFVAHPGRAFARSELLCLVNGDDRRRDDKTARAHIGNIRSKLRPTGTSDYIETLWGFGFRLTEHPR